MEIGCNEASMLQIMATADYVMRYNNKGCCPLWEAAAAASGKQ